MKYLYIIRHAKAESSSREVEDHDRKLINKGIKRANNLNKWLKSKNISDQEMMRTFNCGVGFCIIVSKNNVAKIKKFFSKEYMPYEIGFISKGKAKTNLSNSLKW